MGGDTMGGSYSPHHSLGGGRWRGAASPKEGGGQGGELFPPQKGAVTQKKNTGRELGTIQRGN